jgi:hypothetical protein
MEWTYRTILRVFLVVGGVAIVVVGALEGSTFELALGVLAIVLGAIGLWMERTGRYASTGSGNSEE